MTKDDRQQDQLKHVSGGGHVGGTRFGQQPGDAKMKSHAETSALDRKPQAEKDKAANE